MHEKKVAMFPPARQMLTYLLIKKKNIIYRYIVSANRTARLTSHRTAKTPSYQASLTPCYRKAGSLIFVLPELRGAGTPTGHRPSAGHLSSESAGSRAPEQGTRVNRFHLPSSSIYK